MKNHFELPQSYREFSTLVHNQFSKCIKVFPSDNAAECNDSSFLKLLNEHDNIVHRSCLGTSKQNGRAKRKLGHTLCTVRAMLLCASLPESFWSESTLTIVYTNNCVPSFGLIINFPISCYMVRLLIITLFEHLAVCFALLQSHARNKLQTRSKLCYFFTLCIRIIDAMIMSVKDFAYLDMSFSGNIKCSLVFPISLLVILKPIICLLIYP